MTASVCLPKVVEGAEPARPPPPNPPLAIHVGGFAVFANAVSSRFQRASVSLRKEDRISFQFFYKAKVNAKLYVETL